MAKQGRNFSLPRVLERRFGSPIEGPPNCEQRCFRLFPASADISKTA